MPEEMELQAPAEVRTRPEVVAPWPHTVFLLVVLTLWAAYGLVRLYSPAAATPRALSYASSIIVQSLLAGSTIAGLYHRRAFLSEVLGGFRAEGLGDDLVRGFGVFLGGMAVLLMLGLALRPLHPPDHRAVLEALRPHTRVELALWLLVSLSAGVGEEFLFRGYLLRQLKRWSGSVVVGVAVSTLLFGCMHFYEGGGAVVQITGLGAWYAIVAVRRGNLRTVMIAHFLHDAVTGLALYLHS
jgi:uncharacterized protein